MRGHTQAISERNNDRIFPSQVFSLHLFMSNQTTFRTIRITEAEETALVEIIRYFNDMGLPENVNSEDYDTLTDKVCEPAFWEYE